jgi:AraC family transcriptional regulator
MLTLLENGPLPNGEGRPEVRRPVAAAVSYLQHEWSHLPLRRVGVTEIATAAHVSRGYLNRLFRDTFGSSVSVALEHLRCSRAEALLTRTDLTIAAIARQCGYADVTHFLTDSAAFTAFRRLPTAASRADQPLSWNRPVSFN